MLRMDQGILVQNSIVIANLQMKKLSTWAMEEKIETTKLFLHKKEW